MIITVLLIIAVIGFWISVGLALQTLQGRQPARRKSPSRPEWAVTLPGIAIEHISCGERIELDMASGFVRRARL